MGRAGVPPLFKALISRTDPSPLRASTRFLTGPTASIDEYIETPQFGHASGAIRRYKGDPYVLGDKTMEMGITIAAQLAVFATVCLGPVLAFGIKLMPARAPAGYVRQHLGER